MEVCWQYQLLIPFHQHTDSAESPNFHGFSETTPLPQRLNLSEIDYTNFDQNNSSIFDNPSPQNDSSSGFSVSLEWETASKQHRRNRRYVPRARRLRKLWQPVLQSLVVNLSNYNLTVSQIALLSKGLNFCPTPQKLNRTEFEAKYAKFSKSNQVEGMVVQQNS